MASNTASTTQKTFTSASLNIYGNLLLAPGTCMQIRNVSQVFFGMLSQKRFPVVTFLLLFFGGIAAAALDPPRYDPSPIFILGLFATFGAIILAIAHAARKPIFGLHIVMNAGTTYTFQSQNPQFVEEAYKTLCQCFNQPEFETNNYLVNFANGTIVNHSAVAGGIHA